MHIKPNMRKDIWGYRHVVTAAFMAIGFGIVFQYYQNAITEDQAKFWFSVLCVPFFIFATLASLATGETYAKGLTITEKNNPIAFSIMVISSAVISIVFLILAIYYW